jgi:aryl-alcohol dehydrogenase-like predicted oxidoreductase
MIKDLFLGTAQWGWTTEKQVAFQLLDAFYKDGFRHVDCATNYPINGNPADFRAAENILTEWLRAHAVRDMKVMMKIGSLSNKRSAECNLGKSFLLMSMEQYKNCFHENLDCLMIHWDNRSDENEIAESLEAMEIFRSEGIQAGLSGIKHPELYAVLNEKYHFDFYIQLKHNLLQSDFQKYESFHRQARFIAYGLNAGGIKLHADAYHANSVLLARGGQSNADAIVQKLTEILSSANQRTDRPPITEFFQMGMLYATAELELERVLVAPSDVGQWKKTLEFFRNMQQFDYPDVVNALS